MFVVTSFHLVGWGPYAYFQMLEETGAVANPTDEQAEDRGPHIGLCDTTHTRTLDELESGRV